MKVLHLGKFCPPTEGGIEVFTYDLLGYLNKIGVKADLLCFGRKDEFSMYKNFSFFSSKTHIKLNSAPLSLSYIKRFLKIQSDYEIIHIHSPNPLAELLTIFTNKPVIVHWHSDIVKQKLSYLFYKPLQQKVLKKARKIICTSPQYLQTSIQLKNFKEKSVVVPLGLDFKRLSFGKRDNKFSKFLKIRKNKKVVLSIGRLVEYKGFEYLIEAGKYINDNVNIVIIGEGPSYDILSKKIKKLKLENKVFLFGKVKSIAEYIKSCDVFVLPSISRNEAFGLVLVEALYFGKPLITTNVYGSGMSYVNQNKKTGLIVPPRNSQALAKAINEILSNEEIYKYFSRNAIERFKEFNIDTIGNKILKLYENVI